MRRKIKGRGFKSLTDEERRRVASLGGKAAHAEGKRHVFTHEEARTPGEKAGLLPTRHEDDIEQFVRCNPQSKYLLLYYAGGIMLCSWLSGRLNATLYLNKSRIIIRVAAIDPGCVTVIIFGKTQHITGKGYFLILI